MSKLESGLYGGMSGSVGSIVFSQARTLEGKVTTARKRVTPANPQTQEQTNTRNLLSAIVSALQRMNNVIWQERANRGFGELPGWQSLFKMIRSDATVNETTDPDVAQLLPNINGIDGELVSIEDFAAATGTASGEIDVTWTANTVGNANAGDQVQIMAVQRDFDVDNPEGRDVFASVDAARRDAEAFTITGLVTSETYTVYGWPVGAEGTSVEDEIGLADADGASSAA